MKKRYVILFTFTSLMLISIFLMSSFFRKSSTEVSLYEIQPQTIEESVTCTGKVESADSKDVYVDFPCIADTVKVKSGDKVKEGDILFTVNTEATKQVYAAAGDSASNLIKYQQIKTTVMAPVSGIVRSLNVSSGDTVSSDSPCVVISSSDALQVKIAIQENDIKKVEIGQDVDVSGEAFTLNDYSGKVTYISSSARQQYSGTISETVIDAIISINDKDDSLKPGLTAKAKIKTGQTPQCIVVPYEYVLQDEDNLEYVYIYEDGKAIKHVIETGKEYGEGFEIVSGLSAGDQIIKNPNEIKVSGEKVVIRQEGVL